MNAALRVARHALSFLPALVLLAAGPARGEDAFAPEKLALSGSARAGYWSSDRELTDRDHFTPMSVWLKATPDLGDGWSLRAEGWIADERPLRGAAPIGELREALLAWRGETTDVTVGRRIVAWGRADRINPTDIVGSRDYTLLFSEDEEQRRGSLMATVAQHLGDVTLTAYWLPEFRPNIYPIDLPAGVTLADQEERFDAAQGALRLDGTHDGIDWGVSYFDGRDRDPDARVEAIGADGIFVRPLYRRTRQIGADFATTIERFGVRGEIAYRRPAERSSADVFDKGDTVAAVLGADRDLSDALNLNVQYIFHHVADYDDPRARATVAEQLLGRRAALLVNQLTRTQHGGSLRLAYTALNDTLTLELAAIGYATDGSGALRPKASYAVTDAVKLIAGVDAFFGDADSFFGQLRRNRTAYLELRYGF